MMRFMRLLLVCFAAPLAAQGGFDPATSVKLAFAKGAVVVSAPQGAHLKAAFMKVEKKDGPGAIKVGAMTPTNAVDELGDPIWHGTVRIPLTGQGLTGTVTLAVTYQPCTEGEGGVCYPPTTRDLTVDAAAIPPIAAAKPRPEAAPKAAATAEGDKAPEPAASGVIQPSAVPASAVPAPPAAPSGGLLWALLVAYGWGLVSAFSPCVYPMIPITLAIVGAKKAGRFRGLALSLTLVFGMAITYMTLAVLVAKVGGQFGAATQRPGFLVPVALLFTGFGLSLLGLFEIRLPGSLQAKLQGAGSKSGFAGAFFMGLVLGPISAPCVGPYFGTVLTDISQHGEVGLGAAKAFIFALGMGTLFIAVGAFSAALPRSGDWLTRLKHIMGLVVLGFAAWTVRYLVPDWANWAMWAMVALLAAPVLGAFEAAEGLVAGLRKALAILALAAGILLGLRGLETGFGLKLLPAGGAPAEPAAASAWMSQDLEGALAKAKAEHKVVLVDIYAQWCAQCHELDEQTWPDPAVAAWIQANAVPVRIDTDAVRKDLAPKLKIGSYPTVLVLDAEGHEQKRSLGFQSPAAMLAWLKG